MRYLSLCAVVVLSHACTTADIRQKPSRPAVVPDGWDASYDYNSGIKPFLRQHYDSARLEGATAYVYIYSDASSRCRMLRRAMRDERISLQLRDVRITMLDYWRLRRTYEVSPGNAFDPGNASATFVKISMDGDLTDEMFHMGVYMYRQDLYYEDGYSDDRPTLSDLAKELGRFLSRNAEI
jgi:hypothetical protein